MSNLAQNENLIDCLSNGADDAHTAEAISNLPGFASLDPFAASMIFTVNRFKLRGFAHLGWIIPQEAKGVVRSFDGSHELGVVCYVPEKIRDAQGKLVKTVRVAVGDLVPSTAARHRKPHAIPCAAGEALWSSDQRGTRQIAKNEKRAAAAQSDDAPKAKHVAPFAPESMGTGNDGIEVFRARFNPGQGLGSAGIELVEGLSLPEILQWCHVQNVEAQRIIEKVGAAPAPTFDA